MTDEAFQYAFQPIVKQIMDKYAPGMSIFICLCVIIACNVLFLFLLFEECDIVCNFFVCVVETVFPKK